MDIALALQVIIIMGLPASALLGIGIWALRRDSRAPVQAVGILLIGLGAALWIVTLMTILVLILNHLYLMAGSP